MNISVLGAGAWGTALATLLADNGHDVLLWAHEQSVVDDITDAYENKKFLPGIVLQPSINATHDLKLLARHAKIIFVTVPVAFLRSVLQKLQVDVPHDVHWVIASKGIEQHTLMLPTQIIDDQLQRPADSAVISGPSFAYDLASKQVTGLVIAAHHEDTAQCVKQLMDNAYLFTKHSSDLIGVQLAGALKNVLALGVGILDGAGYTDNTKAYFFTRCLHEITQLGIALGAQAETFYGLAGVGDMVLTAMGKLSKNVALGRALGAGQSLDAALQRIGCAPEGLNTLQSLYQLMHKKQIAMPLCKGVYDILFKQAAVASLFKYT